MGSETPTRKIVDVKPLGLHLESKLWQDGFALVCGVDEVGRGPLSGPVVAAAVVFPQGVLLSGDLTGLDDSKKLSAVIRQALVPKIMRVALGVGVGSASVEEIDRINIRRAALLAMQRAIGSLPVSPDFVLVDGRDGIDGLTCPCQAVVGGDSQSATIAAASVVAKEHRDALMRALSLDYPGYGWEKNCGYPTRAHKQALVDYGVTRHHRCSFAPVRAILEKNVKVVT